MSAFLGPIHHVMHERLGLVAGRQEELAAFVRERMSPGQRADFESAWTLRHAPPQGNLSELIGEQPIPRWLQEQMEGLLRSEGQLWALLADRPERRVQLLAFLRGHGLRVGEALLEADPALGEDARRLLQAVDRVLLTSLPCDRVSEVLAAGERAFIVRRDLLFHAEHWRAAGLAEELALGGHEAWLAGLVSALPDARLVRAEVSQGGRRLFDDRLSLVAREAAHGS